MKNSRRISIGPSDAFPIRKRNHQGRAVFGLLMRTIRRLRRALCDASILRIQASKPHETDAARFVGYDQRPEHRTRDCGGLLKRHHKRSADPRTYNRMQRHSHRDTDLN